VRWHRAAHGVRHLLQDELTVTFRLPAFVPDGFQVREAASGVLLAPAMKSAALALMLTFGACGSQHAGAGDDVPMIDAPGETPADAAIDAPARIRTVFVIPLENKADTVIYGNTTDAPYINGLFATANHATNFRDELPSLDSEPHYVWMEAGTNAFSDHTFTTDNDASASNSTSNTAHLVTQLAAAGVPWMSYQEGITAGTCPISSTGNYAAKHDPFVFFQDVVGSPPSASNAGCVAHHKPYSQFEADLAGGQLSGFVFITPDLCHDMHGALTCPSLLGSSANIKAGDTWLSKELPRIIDYANAHDGVIFLTWDEGSSTNIIPFVALGSRVKAGTSATMYTHSSLLKTIEEIFEVPVLPTVASANDFADMFEPGAF
jgi:hypothetical protein